MFWVASAIVIRVGSRHISISVSLFRFGRLGVAVAVDNVTELILGMVLRGDSTLSRGRSLNRSSVGRVRIIISLKFFGGKKKIDENVLGGDLLGDCQEMHLKGQFH